ncbi:MAG: Uma2 family endonuclease [Rhodopirellula sp.]|nr:Uma2 family endonuclease [Rhodopirellula sp.]
MAVASTRQGESRVVLNNVRWQTFEALLAETESAGSRFTYDEGDLEIMSPSAEHELIKRRLGRMIETMTMELEIPIASLGSTTFKAEMKRKGIEPDECYYVANQPRVQGRMEIDLAEDPPPDLVIEVDISSSSLDQLRIYAALGVPEVWICDGDTIAIHHLADDGSYLRRDESLAFPFLPIDQVQHFLDQGKTVDETIWIRSFRSWVLNALKR